MEAISDLEKLSPTARQQVTKRINWLAEHFDQIIPETLDGPWADFFKWRAGDYRVIYDFDRYYETIRVESIDHRSRVYKRRKRST